MEIAVLDDYQKVALEMADWSAIMKRATVTVFNDYVADADTLVDRLQPFDVICVMRERTPLNRAILSRLPKLRLIASTGPRNSSIDIEATAELGIEVAHTGYSAAPTVELTWALILASARNIVDEVNGFRSGHWQQTVGDTLRGKTLGLLGLGNIGSQVVRIGLAFGMEVIAWSEHLDATRAAELGVTRVDKEQLFRLEVVGEVGHVDILIANLAYPHTYAPAHEKTEADLEYACVSA